MKGFCNDNNLNMCFEEENVWQLFQNEMNIKG